MDLSAVVDSIRVERLELMELLSQNRQRMLDTLSDVMASPSMLQNVQPACEQFLEVQKDIESVLKDLDALEQQVLSKMTEM